MSPTAKTWVPSGTTGRRYLALALKAEQEFTCPEKAQIRAQYDADHPTITDTFLCFDGRCNPKQLGIPVGGRSRHYRTPGCNFSPFRAGFRSHFRRRVEFARTNNAAYVPIFGMHFDENDQHLGCRGVGYDIKAGWQTVRRLCHDVRALYDPPHVYPIAIGIETSSGTVHFDPAPGSPLATDYERDFSRAIPSRQFLKDPLSIERILATDLYPGMNWDAIRDVAAIVYANKLHVEKIASRNASADVIQPFDHAESILDVGGVPWHRETNAAFMVSPYGEVDSGIAVAADILAENVRQGRVPPDLLVIGSAVHSGEEADLREANMIAEWHAAHAKSIIEGRLPREMLQYFEYVCAVVDRRHMQTTFFVP